MSLVCAVCGDARPCQADHEHEMVLELYDHVWRWDSKLGGRKGQRCRIVARGRMGSVMVRFLDGETVVTSRWAVRQA